VVRQEDRKMQWYRPVREDDDGPVDGTWCSRPGVSESNPGLGAEPQEGREMQWYRPAKGDGEGPVDGTWCSRPGGSWSYPGLVSDPIQKTGEKSGVCQARTFFLL